MQQEKNNQCPFCQKEFVKSAAFNHAQTCSKDPLHIVLFKGAQVIVPNMELNRDGDLREKPGYEPICPICNEQQTIHTLDVHIYYNHPDEDQLFQNLLKFLYELQKE
ncbi:MAG: hypothetical protein EZS28_031690 [Streblomastix strix]|uniref:Uncharacterized protein n=1 Tax=Streblomastix strix TaxID=222440 RepID=A0A5J4UR25_9EUKA|nr:MAG: hypothetical protein EZS28_031690 [Streblomastix strix]